MRVCQLRIFTGYILLLLAMVSKSSAQSGPPYLINTFAGGGPNNLAATASSIGLPNGVTEDSSGNFYLADSHSARVLKISASGLTVVAGNGVAGYSGDGGLATQAQLSDPTGVSVDSSGNLFIADTGNVRIREVVAATGNIQTVAGNGTPGYSSDGVLATQSELYYPEGVFVDGSGNIFIADTDNQRIREVVAATGNIQTVAGNGTGGFSSDGVLATQSELYYPEGVFVDGSGNIFIADTDNQRIREVSGGIIQTVAGNGTAGYLGDGGGATSAELYYPFGIFVDSAGDIFIGDTDNFRIREVSSGTIQTFAGNGTETYSGDGHAAADAELGSPSGVAVDSSQNVLIADTYNNVVREVLASNGNIQAVAGSGTRGFSGDGSAATQAQLNSPTGVSLDSSGNVYVADAGNDRIRVVNTGASTVTLAGVAIAPGDIGTIAGTGTFGFSGDNGPATQAELSLEISDPVGSGIAAGNNGVLYIADVGNNRIRAVNTGTTSVTLAGVTIPAGDINTIAGNGTAGYTGDSGAATAAELNQPFDVAVDANGNIYVADSGNNRVRVINPGTSTVTVVGVSIPAGDIATIAGDGTAGYLGDNGLATQAELNYPSGVFVDSSGNVFISDTNNFVIREVAGGNNTVAGETAGVINTVAGDNVYGFSGDGGDGIDAEITRPLGIAGDSTGHVLFADSDSSRVRQLTPTVCQTTHIQTGLTLNATVSCTGNFVQGNTTQFMGIVWGDGNQSGAPGGGPNCGVTAGSCSFSASHTYSGNFSGTVSGSVIDANGNSVITVGFQVTIPSSLTINPITLAGGKVGVVYNPQTITATGGATPYTWSIVSGSLPPGLNINSSSGVISGTPTTAGIYNFTVQVEDAEPATFSMALSITITDVVPTITTQPKSQTIGTGGTATLTVVAIGTPPLSYQWYQGTSGTGTQIPGATSATYTTPVLTATTSYWVQVSNGAGIPVDSSTATITVIQALTINTTSLPGGTIGSPYSQTLQASGGTGSYQWSIVSGALPPKLVLSGGVISGPLTTAGTFDFTVQVMDSSANMVSEALSIVVTPPSGAPTCPPPTVVGGSTNPLSVAVTSNCTAQTGSIASTIDWGDGSVPTSGKSASHTYAGAGTYQITVTATNAYNLSATGSASVTITAPVATSVTPGGSTQQSATVTAPLGVPSLSVTYACTSANGPNGQASLSSYGLSCTISPSTVLLTSTPTSVKITVKTSAGSTSSILLPNQRGKGTGWLYAVLMPLAAVVLAGIGSGSSQGCKNKMHRYLGLILLAILLCAWLGCGTSVPPPPTLATPSGQYTVIVTGTTSSTTGPSTITVGFSVTI